MGSFISSPPQGKRGTLQDSILLACAATVPQGRVTGEILKHSDHAFCTTNPSTSSATTILISGFASTSERGKPFDASEDSSWKSGFQQSHEMPSPSAPRIPC